MNAIVRAVLGRLARHCACGLAVTLFLVGVSSASGRAAEATVAVAANFMEAARELGRAFERASGHEISFSFGATGQLYAQISQGAPYDVFLAADTARPEKAVADGVGVPGTLAVYATGRLVLFSMTEGLVTGPETLRQAAFDKLAIANPVTAPYGRAAVETMQALEVHDLSAPKIVRGTNIAQAYQFVATRNAELGFVALSQVVADEGGSRWLVPGDLHAPIEQGAVLLSRGADNPAARAFLAFLRGPEGRTIIETYGYGLPR